MLMTTMVERKYRNFPCLVADAFEDIILLTLLLFKPAIVTLVVLSSMRTTISGGLIHVGAICTALLLLLCV
jgi:hypothetical protein